jgi:cell division protein FtsB
VIENHIRTLLDAPEAGEGAPTLARIEELLASGYARAMAIEGEQWRLQRRIVDVALQVADDYNELQACELRRLAHELREVERDLAGIRALIRSLRARANDARANAA